MAVLDDIKVVDMSHAVAGPYCGMILADFGAQVTKVEHPRGDHFRPLLGGAYHAAINRNKRDIALNLKDPQAVAVVKKLIANADLMIESFTPGTMDRLGLGYEAVKQINPSIIYCSISGFGQTGPYQRLPGYDVVAQAMCGIMQCTGHPGAPPIRIGASWIDMGSGMFAALGAMAALMERQRTGQGKHVDISLMDTALSWMSPLITGYEITGELPPKAGSALPAFSPYQVFAAENGYVFIGASNDSFWKAMCEALGLESLLEDDRFANNDLRVANRDELNEIIEKALAKMDRHEVVEKLRQAGMPCAPVLDVSQVLEDRHVKERGILQKWEHPRLGPLTQVKMPIAQEGSFPVISSPSPAVGQHTNEVLDELGYNTQEIERLLATGAAVDYPGKD